MTARHQRRGLTDYQRPGITDIEPLPVGWGLVRWIVGAIVVLVGVVIFIGATAV